MSDQNSKSSLVLGLAVGIAIVSLLGFTFLLFDKMKNSPVVQNQGTVAGANTNQAAPTPTPTPAPTPPAPTGDFSKVPAVSDSDYIRGDVNAEITLIEYSDFQCPFCARHVPTIDALLDKYEGKVRFVYRHFPLNSIHPNAQKAAEAFECAGEQGKAYEMHDKMFENTNALAVSNLKTYAGQFGLNQSQFDSCLDDGKYASKVNQQARDGQASGISGTPGTWVNNQLVKGAYPVATFEQIIDSLLK